MQMAKEFIRIQDRSMHDFADALNIEFGPIMNDISQLNQQMQSTIAENTTMLRLAKTELADLKKSILKF
jgi:regulator of replication initiation timing